MKSFFVQFNHKTRNTKPQLPRSSGTTAIGVDAETEAEARAVTRARFPNKHIRFTRVSEFKS